MNFPIKHAVRVALAVGGLIAAGATQAADIPSSGNSSLILFVVNTSLNEVYVRDLGVHVDDIIQQGTGTGQIGSSSYGATNTLPYALPTPTLNPDLTLQNFLAEDSTTSHYQWAVIGADSVFDSAAADAGNAVSPTDPARVAITTPRPSDTNTTYRASNSDLITLANSINSDFASYLAPLLTGAGASAKVSIGTSPGQIPVGTGHILNDFGKQPDQTEAALGSSLNFFLFASQPSGSNAAKARTFVLNDLTLSTAGVLSAATEVPLPAAVWLFGSGLLGLAGIGRRRQQQGSRQLSA